MSTYQSDAVFAATADLHQAGRKFEQALRRAIDDVGLPSSCPALERLADVARSRGLDRVDPAELFPPVADGLERAIEAETRVTVEMVEVGYADGLAELDGFERRELSARGRRLDALLRDLAALNERAEGLFVLRAALAGQALLRHDEPEDDCHA